MKAGLLTTEGAPRYISNFAEEFFQQTKKLCDEKPTPNKTERIIGMIGLLIQIYPGAFAYEKLKELSRGNPKLEMVFLKHIPQNCINPWGPLATVLGEGVQTRMCDPALLRSPGALEILGEVADELFSKLKKAILGREHAYMELANNHLPGLALLLLIDPVKITEEQLKEWDDALFESFQKEEINGEADINWLNEHLSTVDLAIGMLKIKAKHSHFLVDWNPKGFVV